MAAIGHPIVGDGKYGGSGQENLGDGWGAQLGGDVSRKLHLHARRLVIDHPDGGTIDATAPLPEHFAETLATLGFEVMDGDNMPLDSIDPALKAEKKAKANAARAKDARKARKGERRSRGGSADARPPRRRTRK